MTTCNEGTRALSRVEVRAIQTRFAKGESISQLAQDLRIPKHRVEKYIGVPRETLYEETARRLLRKRDSVTSLEIWESSGRLGEPRDCRAVMDEAVRMSKFAWAPGSEPARRRYLNDARYQKP